MYKTLITVLLSFFLNVLMADQPECENCCSESFVNSSLDTFDNCEHDCCKWILLPEAPPLFRPFIADPRQVTNSVAWRYGERHFDKNMIAVSFGSPFPLLRVYQPWGAPGVFQFDVEGAVWAIFEHLRESSPLVNADYYVGFPISYAYGPWTFRLRGYHISSHLGDEFLLLHPGFDRRNASSEFIDFFVSWQRNQCLRLYAGVGSIIRNDKEFPRRRFFSEYGGEFFFPKYGFYIPCSHLLIEPFVAVDFRTYADFKYRFDGTIAAGYQLGKEVGLQRRLRFYLEYHNGFCSEGQFTHLSRVHYGALKLTYGF